MCNYRSDTVSVLLGNGDGTFQRSAVFYNAGSGPSGIAVGDFNHDGKYDIVTANRDTTTLSILLSIPVPG
ncbi:MAG: VCBS repeat-containing protein [Candidatus Midichloria sp.]|nr:VCBS repeat-containing protein [Candidatus Midichloria sp.]